MSKEETEEQRARRIERMRRWREANRDAIKEKAREYNQRPEVKAQNRERMAKKYQEEPEYRAVVKARTAQWQKDNRVRANELAANWRARNPEKRRLVWIMNKYRIDEPTAQAIVARDGEPCESCGLEPWKHIDHDHATGTLRGLLCGGCNWAAGYLYDDPARAEGMVRYLMKFVGEKQP